MPVGFRHKAEDTSFSDSSYAPPFGNNIEKAVRDELEPKLYNPRAGIPRSYETDSVGPEIRTMRFEFDYRSRETRQTVTELASEVRALKTTVQALMDMLASQPRVVSERVVERSEIITERVAAIYPVSGASGTPYAMPQVAPILRLPAPAAEKNKYKLAA